LSHGLKQLHLAPHNATPQTLSFLPFFPFWEHFALSSPTVLTAGGRHVVLSSCLSSSCPAKAHVGLSPPPLTRLIPPRPRHWPSSCWQRQWVGAAEVHIPTASCHWSSQG